jgi:hypothetical protein
MVSWSEKCFENAKSRIGEKVGHLTLLFPFRRPSSFYKGIWFAAKCDCGELTCTSSGIPGRSSCGCFRNEKRPRGSLSPLSKRTENEISVVLKLYADSFYSKKDVLDILSITENHLNKIIRGELWKHLNIPQKIKKQKQKRMTQAEILSLENTKIGKKTIIKIDKTTGKDTLITVRCDCGFEKTILLKTFIYRTSKKLNLRCINCYRKK